MKRSDRLGTVCDAFAAHEQAAAARAGDAERAVDAARARLDELETLRRGYAARVDTDSPAMPSALVELCRFLAQLDEVIEGQRRLVETARIAREREKKAWLETRRRRQAVGTARDRVADQERRDVERREQRENDAAGARFARYRSR